MTPFAPQEAIQVETSKEEEQNWIKEMEGEKADIFDISYFSFMPMVTEMVGKRTPNNPQNELLGEDWNQLPPLPQGSLGVSPPTTQDTSSIMDQGLVTLPPLMVEPKTQTLEEG